jgi:hypothetical protein
MYRIEFE